MSSQRVYSLFVALAVFSGCQFISGLDDVKQTQGAPPNGGGGTGGTGAGGATGGGGGTGGAMCPAPADMSVCMGGSEGGGGSGGGSSPGECRGSCVEDGPREACAVTCNQEEDCGAVIECYQAAEGGMPNMDCVIECEGTGSPTEGGCNGKRIVCPRNANRCTIRCSNEGCIELQSIECFDGPCKLECSGMGCSQDIEMKCGDGPCEADCQSSAGPPLENFEGAPCDATSDCEPPPDP